MEKKTYIKHFIQGFIAVALLLSLLFLTSCPSCNVAYAPENFPNTVWATQDGKIAFTVAEEAIERFNGKTVTSSGTYVEVLPSHAQLFGEISTESSTYSFFAFSQSYAYTMTFMSEELPFEAGDEDYYDVFERYRLLDCTVNYKSKRHFVATVESSKIDEIPAGTVLDFYQIDAR